MTEQENDNDIDMENTKDEKEEYDEEEDDASDTSTEDTDNIVKNDKYLIFTTGFKTYTPHQIGKLIYMSQKLFSNDKYPI